MTLSFTIASEAATQCQPFLAVARAGRSLTLRTPIRSLYRQPLLRLTKQARGFHPSATWDSKLIIRAPPEALNYDGSSGVMRRFTKKVGDRIEMDEELGEIEKIKHILDVDSPTAGTITGLLVSPGDKVRPGQGLAVL